MVEKGKGKSGVYAVLLAVLIESLSSSAYLGVAILTEHFVYEVGCYAGCFCDGGCTVIIVVGRVVRIGVVVIGNRLFTG
jgi:hypothetical protein